MLRILESVCRIAKIIISHNQCAYVGISIADEREVKRRKMVEISWKAIHKPKHMNINWE